ncbi:glycoside hydrolase TIM-barrel-like domain-containing protein [Paenibacillus sp. NPDC058071]|uniref:baseplate megatron protein TIM-barrel domain-containing protein n=1 Tax=Paenibacillus sp. NPDC058071 TaxID=3346326 RepID=UPI0036D7706F
MKKLITWMTVISMILAYGAEAAAYVPDYKEKVEGVTMIPSSGVGAYADQVIYQINYLYDSTWPNDPDIGKIYWETTFNDQNTPGTPNIRISTEQLQTELPNNKWIALTIGWQLDFEQLEVRPMVEKKEEFEQETITIREQDVNDQIVFKQYVRTIRKNVLIDEATYQRTVSNGYVIEAPQSYWKVGSEDRNAAQLIDPSITYGETPSDQEIIEAVRYYKSQGYQVMIYPFLLGYRADKPWRGRLALSSEAQVHNFMTKSTGYNSFIGHYIQLLKNERIDGFLVGSEMEALTLSASPEYPAVDHLIQLIREAKAEFGSRVQVSYAANWSEYHHDPSNGYYHLDKLWKEADFVGIDAYFPLTEQHSVDYQEIYNGWQSGEYFDYYYEGTDYENRLPIQEKYAIKNIQYWWENEHFNPDGSQTDWIPRSKKIWFTELGFASVNGTTVQPNIFVDPTSLKSGYPRGSNSETSVMAQAVGLDAALDFLNTQPWIGNVFVWTWDARPFPAFPLSSFWSDGGNWEKGHWLQGKTHPSISGDFSVETLRREYPEYTDSQSLIADPIDTSNGAHVINKNLMQLYRFFYLISIFTIVHLQKFAEIVRLIFI